MRGELVAIDLETTGLDVSQDKIIEIGAVRMKEGQVLKEYSTLVNPDAVIPDRTTLLTGIRQEDVVNAPHINEVLPDLLRFVGDAPIIGHSVSFDLSFLNRHGLFTSNTALDTYDLASVLLPTAARYNLHSLTSVMGIELEDAHRALDDARASGVLYWKLYERALQLPLDVLHAIDRAAKGLPWYAAPAFSAALEERLAAGDGTETAYRQNAGGPSVADLPRLRPNDEVVELDINEISAVFQPGGQLSSNIEQYEHRREQEQMAALIAHAFNENEHLFIEAGTGTGKSIAYLVPAFEWAVNNNERVVISTDTIALQDQLINKDIPALQQALGVNLNAAVLKGRTNYLCPISVEAMKRRGPTSIEELRVLAKIMVWQLSTESGDKTEISLRGPAEHSIWNRLSAADNPGCRRNDCLHELGVDCPFFRASKKAAAAHILIVNHALLVADNRADSRLLPEYNYIVIDEGHHLEEAVTHSLSFALDENQIRRRMEDLGNANRGLLADLLKSLRASDVPAKKVQRIADYIESVNQAANDMQAHVQQLFEAVRTFVGSEIKINATDFVTYMRILEKHRSRSAFNGVRQSWDILSQFMEVIAEAANDLSAVLTKLDGYEIENYNDLLRSTQSAAQFLTETQDSLIGFIEKPDSNTIYWLEVYGDGQRVALKTAPLHVGREVAEHLWNQRQSVILTSATLRTNGSFKHLQNRLEAFTVPTVEVGSPFDYKNAAMVYLPTDIAEPNQSARHQQAIEQSIIALASALDGRVMALFTSYGQLRQTSRSITPRLALGNITVYDQSDGTSRQSLLEGFKSTEKAVLLGTRSFWEGVDIPGESLSALVIAKLPFPVPTDPIVSARSETYDQPFNEYSVPEAILRFRQGFGRLIRTRTDRGIVVILDARLTSKRYGTAFLDALPDCTIKQAPLGDLAKTAQDWLQASK